MVGITAPAERWFGGRKARGSILRAEYVEFQIVWARDTSNNLVTNFIFTFPLEIILSSSPELRTVQEAVLNHDY